MRTFWRLSSGPEPPETPNFPARSAIQVFLAALLLSVAVLTFPQLPLGKDTDSSWRAMLAYAYEHNLQFGPDIAFTFGPLGFLTIPGYSGIAVGLRMAVDVALCVIVSVGCCLVAWRLAWPRRVLLLALFTILCSSLNSGGAD